MQNYLVFQPMYKYFKRVIDSCNNSAYVHYWQSKGLSDEKHLLVMIVHQS